MRGVATPDYNMAGSEEEDAGFLTINDLQEVFEEMYEARDKWRNIGGVFGVSESTLRCIGKEEHDEDGKLRRVIEAWLRDHGGTSKCSWTAVAKVLRNKTVGRADIAREVAANHPSVQASGQASGQATGQATGQASGQTTGQLPRSETELSKQLSS